MRPVRIVIHCSDNSNGSLMTGEDIRRFHKAPPPKGRGWSDIGYHGVIEIDGGFFQGRPDDQVGAHVTGHNTGSLGVCLVGRDRFSPKQFETLAWYCENKSRAYGIPYTNVYGHHEFDSGAAQGKTCPNLDMNKIRLWLVTRELELIRPYLIVPNLGPL